MEFESTSDGGRDFMEEEASVAAAAAEERSRRYDDSSSALAEKLLQGWTLLNEHCPQCLTPLVRNRQRKIFCAACRQWILTEAEAAARAAQQRVDRIEVAEQSPGVSAEQSPSPSYSVATANAAPLSPSQRGNGKNNGVNLLRLSLGRAEEEKLQDGRNPKRFASSEPTKDSSVDGKENGMSRPGVATGLFKGAQRDAAPPSTMISYSKPGLVIQPAVNPVNDILVARRTLTTLNEKLEGIRQLISGSHDVNELRQLFAVLEECIHAIEVTRALLKSVE